MFCQSTPLNKDLLLLFQILNKTQQDYSLVKQGWWDIFLNVDYTYFGDARSQDALILEQTRGGRNQPPSL